nr:hypothetical protein BaRGS_020775 [Batillaria attramentaria]
MITVVIIIIIITTVIITVISSSTTVKITITVIIVTITVIIIITVFIITIIIKKLVGAPFVILTCSAGQHDHNLSLQPAQFTVTSNDNALVIFRQCHGGQLTFQALFPTGMIAQDLHWDVLCSQALHKLAGTRDGVPLLV